MISDGKSFYSVSGINNNFSYSLLNNLTLNGNVGLFIMQSPLQNQNPLIELLSIAYDASITYQPFKNSILQFRVQKSASKKLFSILHWVKLIIGKKTIASKKKFAPL